MRILVVTQYYWPENFKVNDMVDGLIERGYQVTVLTGLPNYPDGKIYKGYGGRKRWMPSQETHRGAQIVRVPLVPRGESGQLRLLLNYFTFALSASVFGLAKCGRRFDLILTYQPSPITTALPALLLRKWTGVPLFLWVQDLWPDSLTALMPVRSGAFLNALHALVGFIYRRCDRILVQSRSFTPSIMKYGVPEDRIDYFPNWAESLYDAKLPAATAAVALLPPSPHEFRILFAGNLGAAQNLGILLDAAEMCLDVPELRWVVVGDGRVRAWMESEVRKRKLDRVVRMLGKFPQEAMPAFFERSDALLVMLRKNPLFALTVPSKLQAYMAYGKPLIASIDGECARIVNEAGAGLVCPADDAAALAEAARSMRRKSKPELQTMGANGRQYYVAHFEREALLDKLQNWIDEHNLNKDGSVL